MKHTIQGIFSFSGFFLLTLVAGSIVSVSLQRENNFFENVSAADINLNVDSSGVVRDSSGKILKGTKIDIQEKDTTQEGVSVTDKKVTTQNVAVDTTAKEDVRAVIASEKSASSSANTQKKLDTRYRIEKVERIKAAPSGEKEAIRFSGKALPNTVVTIYIYSTPTVVVVQSDAEGNWSYDLTQDLEDGDHEVFVAVTDATGKISSYGEGVGFVKTAEAITVKPVALAAVPQENQSPLERSRFEYMVVAFISVLVFFGIALIVVSRRATR